MDIRQMCEMLKKLHSLEELVLFELPSVHKLPLTLDDIVDESSTIFENPSLAIRNPNFYVLDVEGVLRYQDHKLAVPVILLLSMYMPTLKNIKMDGFEEASSLMDSMLLELYIIMHQKHT
ncbi:hypothetical protein GGI12_003653 [Dipsacomyces acuminosporus]|nr:hypothetical protein GGI12_003653 [Dipsacomyces acuminosporus]